MSNRSYQNLGIALMVLPCLVAVAILVARGQVVSTNPSETTAQSGPVVMASFHWAELVALLLCFIAGLICIVRSSRRTR